MRHTILVAVSLLCSLAHAQERDCEIVGAAHRPACVSIVRAVRRDRPSLLRALVRSGDEVAVRGETVRGPGPMLEAIVRAGGLRQILGSTMVELSYGAPRNSQSRGPMPGQIVMTFENGTITVAIDRGRAHIVSIDRRGEVTDEPAYPVQ